MTKHIAIFIPSLRGGGAERVMVTLANGFAARGFRTDLVLSQAVGPYLEEVAANVRVVDLGSSRVALSLLPLMRYFRRSRPMAMLSALGHANVIAAVAKQLSGVRTRLVVSEHSTLSDEVIRKRTGRSRLLPFMMTKTYRFADSIVAVSEGSAHALSERIGVSQNAVRVIYNPIDCEHIRRLSLEPPEHPWFREVGLPIVLAVGRLTAAKDHKTLIRAFARVRQKQAARLVILGEGECRNELGALVKTLGLDDCVSMPGFANNPFQYMRRAQLFVLSSAWEGLPTVLLEAMACGTKVVSTNCKSGPSEILELGKWGELVPVGNDEALADSIIKNLDEQQSVNFSDRLEVFSPSKILDTYEDELFKGRPGNTIYC
ncbi:glycosyltransferase [Nitrosomonas sp. ANs5]|uniref:glycosyltransferase n=1 Tax=Nitrosomonas sp. ANs5 TaxID=3423941 RepID=UPI003D33E1EA